MGSFDKRPTSNASLQSSRRRIEMQAEILEDEAGEEIEMKQQELALRRRQRKLEMQQENQRREMEMELQNQRDAFEPAEVKR